jgi:protein-S-isoprenylcysteine O-methyltransferase Ste14
MSHPVRELLLTGSVGVWVVIEVRQALNRRPGATSSDRGSLLVLRLLAVLGGILATLAHNVTAASFAYTTALFGISLCLIWAGIGLRLWSFQALGRYFTFTVMTSPDQAVITTGPYRVLRHPSYAAILLILIGIGISLANWLSLAALIGFVLIGLLNRIRVEEAALSATLGERYTNYASGRKRLIPFVW